jgi:predicted membrane channel-forming protein YqfA (hemolysin III family)
VTVLLILLAVALFAVFMRAHSRHKTPAKAAVVNMILGVLTLAVIAPILSVAVNWFTVFVALTLGVPGTALITLVALI